MGRELQKKKRRSGRQPVRQATNAKKLLNPRGNTMIAKNWNKKETLSQNYRRLGLVARLKTPTGGTETKLKSDETSSHPDATDLTSSSSSTNPFGISSQGKIIVSEAKVERDADGNIIRVLSHSRETTNPLNDPLNDLEDDSEADSAEDMHEEWGGIMDGGGVADGEQVSEVVRSLVEKAQNPAPKKPRYLSEREAEWLGSLVAKYGDDTAAMARDHKLNPMQQTARDIARRLKKLQT